MFRAQCSVLNVRCSMFRAHRPVLIVRCSFTSTLPIRFSFKRVISIRIPPGKPKAERRKKIGGPHERPPSFELPNVHHFMVTRDIERSVRLAEDRVTERNGECERPWGQVRHKPLDCASMKLDRPTTNTRTATST
jgi:hypothetical protein